MYDFRDAPFDLLTATADHQGLFAAEPPRRDPFGMGVHVFRRCVRLVLAS